MSKQIEQESMKAPAEENGRLLTDKDIRKCAWRWCMSVNGFNYETQLAPSVVFSEADALKKIYRDDDAAYRDSLTNSAKYFNVTPPVAGILLGAGLAMEEKNGAAALGASKTSRLASWDRSPESVTPSYGFLSQQSSVPFLHTWRRAETL